MYLSISNWREPALATLASVGGAVGVGEGVAETWAPAPLLVDPQPTSSSAASDVSAVLNLNRWKRTPSTSAMGYIRDGPHNNDA
jgi:hypothetical protein